MRIPEHVLDKYIEKHIEKSDYITGREYFVSQGIFAQIQKSKPIMYHPLTKRDLKEFVEILNKSSKRRMM